MTDKQNSNKLEIIALGFYDGATEGFSLCIKDLGVSYFKLIAWDENQDQRLFVVVPIAKLIFDTIFNLLSLSNDPPNSSVWLPKWVFKSNQDETKANQIVNNCVSDINSKGVFILGDQINNGTIYTNIIHDDLIRSIHDAMNNPGRLQIWLNKIKYD